MNHRVNEPGGHPDQGEDQKDQEGRVLPAHDILLHHGVPDGPDLDQEPVRRPHEDGHALDENPYRTRHRRFAFFRSARSATTLRYTGAEPDSTSNTGIW